MNTNHTVENDIQSVLGKIVIHIARYVLDTRAFSEPIKAKQQYIKHFGTLILQYAIILTMYLYKAHHLLSIALQEGYFYANMPYVEEKKSNRRKS